MTSSTSDVWDRVRSILRSPFVLVFAPLFVLYLATVNHESHEHIDPLTNSLTAWHIGMTGSVTMPDHSAATAPEYRGNLAWIVESRRGPVSQYPPGSAALAAPFYFIADEPLNEFIVEGLNRPNVDPIPFPLPSPWPAAIAASMTSALAMGLVAATIHVTGGTYSGAIVAGYVGGLGTTLWATASNALWQHGPASMWVALGIYLAARSKFGWCGLAFGGAILTRPHLAVIAAAVGLSMSLSQRKVSPAAKVGLGSLVGLLALLWFNWWAWGEVGITSGYSDVMAERFFSPDMGAYAWNVMRAFLDPFHGLFTYSPWILVLIPGVVAGWRAAPPWARGAAIGGLVYFLVQLKANRFSGGDGFLGYRYPLEALIAAGTVLYLAYVRWVAHRPVMRKTFWAAAVVSLAPELLWKFGVLPGSR